MWSRAPGGASRSSSTATTRSSWAGRGSSIARCRRTRPSRATISSSRSTRPAASFATWGAPTGPSSTTRRSTGSGSTRATRSRRARASSRSGSKGVDGRGGRRSQEPDGRPGARPGQVFTCAGCGVKAPPGRRHRQRRRRLDRRLDPVALRPLPGRDRHHRPSRSRLTRRSASSAGAGWAWSSRPGTTRPAGWSPSS